MGSFDGLLERTKKNYPDVFPGSSGGSQTVSVSPHTAQPTAAQPVRQTVDFSGLYERAMKSYPEAFSTRKTAGNDLIDRWTRKYQGKGYNSLADSLADMEEGEEKDWLKGYADYVDREEKRKVDLKAYGKEIADLETELDRWMDPDSDIGSMTWMEYDAKIEEMQKDLDQRKRYYTQAKRIQEEDASAEKYGNVSKNADFASKSGLDPKNQEIGYQYVNADSSGRMDLEQQYGKYATQFADMGIDSMNDEERAVYNYYMNSGDREEAAAYLRWLEETLQTRKGEETDAALDRIAEEAPGGAKALRQAFMAGVGYDQHLSGMKGLGSMIAGKEDYVPATATQVAGERVREDLGQYGLQLPEWMGGGSTGQMVGDLISTTANMAPSMMVGATIGRVIPGAGAAVMGASAGGSSYQEKINEGYSKEQARKYGIAVGASEMALSAALSGIKSLGGGLTNFVIEDALQGVKSGLGRFIIEYGGSIASEALEEGIQEILTPIFSNRILGTDEKVDWGQVVYSALLGGLSAGILEGPSAVASARKGAAEARNATAAPNNATIEKTSAVDDKMKATEVGAENAHTNVGVSKMENIQRTDDLDSFAQQFGTQADDVRRTFMEDQDLQEFEVGFQNAYAMGLDGGKQEALGSVPYLSKSQREVAFILGRDAAAAQKADEPKKAVVSARLTTEEGTQDVTIAEVVDMDDNTMTFRLEDGRTVTDNDLDFEKGQLVMSAVWETGMDVKHANTIIKASATNTAADADQAVGIQQAYHYGQQGYTMKQLAQYGTDAAALTDGQRKAAWEAGRQIYMQKASDPAPTVKAKRKSGVWFDAGNGNVRSFDEADLSGLSESAVAGARAAQVLQKLGIGRNYYFYESYVNKDGERVYKDENGVEQKAPNGWYDVATGDIHIDLNAGSGGKGLTLYTLSHELTHFVEDWDKQGYRKLSEFLVANYAKHGNVDAMVAAKQAELSSGRGSAVSYEEAYSEFIADSMEAMLSDGNVLEKLQELKKTDDSLFGKIKEFFDNMARKIRAIYKNLTPDSVEGQAVLQMKDQIDQIQKLFTEALVEAGSNFNNAIEQVIQEGAEPVLTEEIVTDGAVVTDGNGARYSIRSMKSDIAEGKMFDDLQTYCNWSDAQVNQLKKDLTELVDYMTPFRDVLDLNETYGREGRRFSPCKPNSDPLYQISMDFSTLCSKRLLTQFVIENLQLRENRPMTAEEQMAIRNMLIEYRKQEKGLQVACAMCYVEAARLKSPKQMQRWLNDPAPLLKDYFGKKNKAFNDSVRKAQADFKESRGYERDTPKKEMKQADIRELNKIGPRMRGQYQLTAEETAVVERALELPNSTYLTAGNLAALSESDPVIYDAYTSFVRTATRSKSLETDEPYYYGDSRRDNGNGIIVSDSFIEAVNRENGMRFSSWSDWRIQHMLDYITAVIDNAVRGAAMHGYTKFPEEVRVLGRTGMMFNLSGVAGTQTGLNEDGSLSFSPTESIDRDEAVKLREDFPETAGLQCIGVGDDHIRELMKSDIIDYIIPYHVSGLNKALRTMADIQGWKDYTGTQHASIDHSVKLQDAADPEHWHEEPVFSEFFVGYDTGMTGIEAMQESAERYRQMCHDRGLIPKFNQFYEKGNNYWKLLIDRKMINQKTGKLIQQKPVTPTFDFNEIKAVVKRHVDNYDSNMEARALNHIVENWDSIPSRIKDLKKGKKKTGPSLKAVNEVANQMLAAQKAENPLGIKPGEVFYSDIRKSERVKDKRTLEFLNNQETITTYKTMQLVDGKLYPPMAARTNGEYEDYSMLGSWEQATEHPELIQDGNKYKLDKGKGQGSLKAAYNPYMHSSNLVLNDQFTGAYTRNNLVTVECEVPVSELTSGYHAQYAKDPVGWHAWHTGTVAGSLRKARGIERQVFLSRWIKPVRILPDSEVASMYSELLSGTDIEVPDNVVTPSLLKELRNAGVKIKESGRIKSDANKDIRYSDRKKAPTFYSYMGTVVSGMKQEKFGAASVVNMLRGKGVKAEEIKWSGIEAWLEGKKSVTKAELQEFIAGSMLQIEEETHSGGAGISIEPAGYTLDGESNNVNVMRGGEVIDFLEWDDFNEHYVSDALGYSFSNEDEIIRYYSGGEDNGDTRWGEYKLDGGENYREILFRLPEATYTNSAMQNHWGSGAEGILAHVRMQDFDTEDGKMLFIEEIQSDWHNEGHKRGYRSEDALKKAEAAKEAYRKLRQKLRNDKDTLIKDLVAFYRTKGYDTPEKAAENDLQWHPSMMDTYRYLYQKANMPSELVSRVEEFQANMDKQRDLGREEFFLKNQYKEGIPDAPFRDNYHEFVLKRLIREAAEKGYDSIGWTTADIQSKRWSDDYAEGYRIEYDQDIPKFLRKYGKKWGATVGKKDIQTKQLTLEQEADIVFMAGILEDGDAYIRKERGIEQVWSMPITKAMKDSVLYEGQVMYQARATGNSNRDLLAGAFEDLARSPAEMEFLQKYQENIGLLNEQERKLQEIRTEIRDLTFGNGPKNPKRLEQLQEEAGKTANRIHIYDKKLLQLEAAKPLRDVLDREREKVRKATRQKGQEAMAEYREKRKESAARKDAKRKIRKTVMELDKLLNRGDKKKNVKSGMTSMVDSVLKLADALFMDEYTNRDMLRNGVGVELTDAEEKLFQEAQQILHQAESGAAIEGMEFTSEVDAMEQLKKVDQKLSSKMAGLKDVFARERKRLYGTTVSDLLGKLADEYSRLSEAEDGAVRAAKDENVYAHLLQLQKDVGGTTVRDMTLGQMEAVADAFTMVLTTVRNANKMFAKNLKFKRDTLAGMVMGEIGAAVKKVSKLIRPGKNAIDSFSWNNLKPAYAFERLGSETLKTLYQNIRGGQDVWSRDMQEADAFRREQYKKHNRKAWNMEKQHRFEFESGIVELNLEQIMSLYAYSRREQALDHLLKGGFVFSGSTEVMVKEHGIQRRYLKKDATAYNLTADELLQVVETLTKEQKAFVEEMQTYLSDVMGGKGNEISLQMYGIKSYGEKNYFPIRSAGQYMERAKEDSFRKEQGQISIVNSGFTKNTTPKANNPITLDGFMNVWADHVNEMSMYHGFALPMEDFRRVYNYSSPNMEVGNSQSVNAAIENAFGKAATNYIDQLFKDLNGGAVSDNRENLSKKLVGLHKKAAVFASASVVVQQPSAIVRAFALIDPTHFVGPKVDQKRHKQLWEEIKKYAPVAFVKEMGYFDTGMGRSARDFLQAEEYTGIREKMVALFKDADYRDEFLGKAPALSDEITWCSIWEAVKRETKSRNYGMDVRSDEFLKIAGERFSEIIDKTQVYDSVLSRSANMRSKSLHMNMLTSFLAEPTTSINMLEDALRKGDRKQMKRTAGAVYGSVLLNSLLVSLVYAARDDDEDETFWEKYLSSVAVEMLDGLNPITYYPFLKDIWSIGQGFDVERSDMSLITDFADAAKKVVGGIRAVTSAEEGEEESAMAQLKDSLWGMVDTIANLTGLPVKNVRRDIEAARNVVSTISTDRAGRMTTKLSLKDAVLAEVMNAIPIGGLFYEKSKRDRLYGAIVAKDKSYVDRLKAGYETDESYHSAIRLALRDHDSRIWEAAVAWNNNDLKGYMALAREIIAEGNFIQDDVVLAIRAEASAMDESESASSSAVKGYFTNEKFGVAMGQNNTAMADAIRKDLIDTKVANGKTRSEAEEAVESTARSQLKELYEQGEISGAVAQTMLVRYGGYDQQKASDKVSEWKYGKDNPELDGRITYTQYKRWEADGKSRGVPLETYTEVAEYRGGDTSSGTRSQEDVAAYINSMPISTAQKDALWCCFWSEKTLYKNAPWH